jgi:uncharacterized protein YuzE
MKVQHDREADAIYIEVSSARPDHGIDVPGLPGISVDVDNAGRIVGIEILDVSKTIDPSGVRELSFEDLVSGEVGKIVLGSLSSKGEATARKVS